LASPKLGIFDADRAKAERLAMQLRGRLQARVADDVASALHGAAGVVNATPVGMLPDRGMAVPEALLHRDLWVADAVYTPLWTPLLTAARATGAKVMTGRELAIYQAADAFELFTGLNAAGFRNREGVRRRDGKPIRCCVTGIATAAHAASISSRARPLSYC
jgi:shikimate dehydrogenase